MSTPIRPRPTKNDEAVYRLIVEIPGQKSRLSFVHARHAEKLETFLKKYSTESVPWEELAAERIAQYGRGGLALRGARYREGLSQKELARRSGVSQENISKMENGSRAIGPKVAEKLANALNIKKALLLQ